MRDEEDYAITLPTGDQAAAQVGESFGWAQVFVERVTSRVILAVEQRRSRQPIALVSSLLSLISDLRIDKNC